MRRKKRIWIALAALVAVVALCVIVFLYRPRPYAFLNGAKNEGTFVLERAVTRGSAVATHHYLLDEPFEVAVKEVGAELMAEGDWVAVGSIPGRYENTRTNKHIEVMRPQWVNSKADPGKAVVWVTEPATIFDRLIAWMHKRYFRVPRSYPPGTSATQLT